MAIDKEIENITIQNQEDAEAFNEFIGDAPFESGCLPTAIHLNRLCEHHGPYPTELDNSMTRLTISGLQHAHHPRAEAAITRLGLSTD